MGIDARSQRCPKSRKRSLLPRHRRKANQLKQKKKQKRRMQMNRKITMTIRRAKPARTIAAGAAADARTIVRDPQTLARATGATTGATGREAVPQSARKGSQKQVAGTTGMVESAML